MSWNLPIGPSPGRYLPRPFLPPPFLIILALLFFSGCASKNPPGMVRDLRELPQRVASYLGPDLNQPVLSPERQANLAREFLRRHFAPWDADFDPLDPDDDPFWGLKSYEQRQGFGENLLPLSPDWLPEMVRQSAVDLYPSLNQPAVTVVATSLRVLPTHGPVFSDPSNPGEGFPFDYMQNSLVSPGTPVRVVHASLDGAWYLVKTGHVSGWVRPWEVAWADRDFMDAFRSSELVGFARDGDVLTTQRGMFAAHGRVGMVLPRSSQPCAAGMVSVLVPQRGADGWAEAVPAKVARSATASWPMAATLGDMAAVLDGLLNQPYGWGGLFENRDCSALIQDVFALLGIAMPRNSRAQARAGTVVNLDGLSREDKEAVIATQGQPLLTIVNMPGHVMLYLGRDPAGGRPVVMHSMWGLRTEPSYFWKPAGQPASATPGRWVLGRTVITTLTPGEELSNLAKPLGLLLERVSSMTFVTQRK
jgi:cell wall-associated NlpC family hydrolase